MRTRRRPAGLRLTIVLACTVLMGVLRSSAATLDTHTVVLDGQGKLIPWTANPADGYDRVMRLSWDLLLNRIPLDPANGLPVTYTHCEYTPGDLSGTGWPNNPGSKNAMLATRRSCTTRTPVTARWSTSSAPRSTIT